jgi:hypothetical protein
MLLVIFAVAVILVGLLFYRRPLKVDRSDLAPRPPEPRGPSA